MEITEKEVMYQWDHSDKVHVSEEDLKRVLEILKKNGFTSVCIESVPYAGWVIKKLF